MGRRAELRERLADRRVGRVARHEPERYGAPGAARPGRVLVQSKLEERVTVEGLDERLDDAAHARGHPARHHAEGQLAAPDGGGAESRGARVIVPRRRGRVTHVATTSYTHQRRGAARALRLRRRSQRPPTSRRDAPSECGEHRGTVPPVTWPAWWEWEIELTPHLEKRMEDRDFTEVDLRAMLHRARGFKDDVVGGRFVIETDHKRAAWEVIVEPDEIDHLLVVVTAYPVSL